jgi:GntR family transcriptional regulator/MocR family aminotransferase
MPKQTPHIPLPGIQLDATAAFPLRRQLYDQLGRAIRTGHLAPGTRLPSTRAFARDLGVSRTTVEEAYQDLRAEGYLEGQIGSGTYVVDLLPENLLHVGTDGKNVSANSAGGFPAPVRLSQRGTTLAQTPPPPGVFSGRGHRPFRVGLPAFDVFPHQEWARQIARAARQTPVLLLNYQDPAGYRPLREEVAAYLNISRGVRCTVDQVVIVAGAQMGLSLAAQLLLDPGNAVWMEDPGYAWAKVAFRSVGATLVSVPIDAEGMDVAVGRTRCPEARLAYVTPSHQFPLGVAMSLTRRYDLLRWAQQAGSWIIEDDYDSEYRYVGRPIPALQGLDDAGRVIYLGTFSKVLFPALRLGYIVAPPAVVDTFIAARQVADIHPPVLEQVALAAFMADGHFARHIRRMRGLYAERGEALKASAERYLGETLTIERPTAGLHLVGWLPPGSDDREMARIATSHDIDTLPLSAYRMESSNEASGILLGYASFTESEINDGMRRLAEAWNRPPRSFI